MSANLIINKTIQDNVWSLDMKVDPSSDIPVDIFLYENTGTTELGKFYCIAAYNDYIRFQPWTGVAVPVFGNRFVKVDKAHAEVPLTDDPELVAQGFVQSAQTFRTEFLNAGLNGIKTYPL